MRPNVKLTLDSNERAALRALSADERDALVDDMLASVRDDLAWLLAIEAARGEALERAQTERTRQAATRRAGASQPPPLPKR
jgi:hypothetical protein